MSNSVKTTSTTTPKTALSIYYTKEERLSKLPIKNGQLIFIGDKREIAFDFKDKREIYSNIQILDTEEERIKISSPLESFYFVEETAILWRYSSDKWKQLTTAPTERAVLSETYLNFPTVGSTLCIYIATGENATYRWDAETLSYKCIGRDWHEIQLIDANFD